MGRKGLRYRLSVYLVISLCMIVPAVLLGRHDMVPLVVGMYLPVAVLTEFGLVRIISRYGGVENARRKGFKERLAVDSVLAVCWILVALILGWQDLVPVIVGILLPLMILFDLLFIYRVLSRRPWKDTGLPQ